MIFDQSRIVLRENAYKIRAGARGWVADTAAELKLMMQNTSPMVLVDCPMGCDRPTPTPQTGRCGLFYVAPKEYVETVPGHEKDLVWEGTLNNLDLPISEYVAQLPLPGYQAVIRGNGNFWVWAIHVGGTMVYDGMEFALDVAMDRCREQWVKMLRNCLYNPTNAGGIYHGMVTEFGTSGRAL